MVPYSRRLENVIHALKQELWVYTHCADWARQQGRNDRAQEFDGRARDVQKLLDIALGNRENIDD